MKTGIPWVQQGAFFFAFMRFSDAFQQNAWRNTDRPQFRAPTIRLMNDNEWSVVNWELQVIT